MAYSRDQLSDHTELLQVRISATIRLAGQQRAAKNVALVAGSTGLTGEALVELLSRPDTAGAPWKVYGLARRAKQKWHKPDVFVQCDLLKKNETLEKVSPMTDVTHVFWVAWANRSSEKENCDRNGGMLQNLLGALLPNAKRLQHVCLQTGAKHYFGSYEQWEDSYDQFTEFPEAPFTEDLPRLPGRNFYYTLEDLLFQAVKQKQDRGERLTWSVHRPGLIFGFSARSKSNVLSTLSVYGSLCKELGLSFIFPGTRECWDSYTNASDADLIAEQQVWAATDPAAKNQAFNCTNGDVFKWKTVWETIAGRLGLIARPPPNGPPLSLYDLMKSQGPLWQELVKKHTLTPTKLVDLGHWWLVELVFAGLGCDTIMCTNKNKEFGFLKFRNTMKGIVKHLDTYVQRTIIPSSNEGPA